MTSKLRAHNATLQEQLAAERRSSDENWRIITAMTQRIPELEAPAPTERPPDGPEPATAAPDRVGPQEQEQPAERPWWRRIFEG